jgi:hypothetical protein
MKIQSLKDNKGSALLPFITIVPFLILITGYFMSMTVSNFRLARADQLLSHAQMATDAGIDTALREINIDNEWLGTTEEVDVHNGDDVRTTYEITIESPNEDEKTIISTGRSYNPSTSTTPNSEITIRADLRPVRTGEFSVVSGVGGLFMSNSSKIIGGDVHINGSIMMENSAQIGLAINPLTIDVAHQNCPVPADGTYPQLCDAGENGQPISISNPAQIVGTVRANNQTNGGRMVNPGLASPTCMMPSAGGNCVESRVLPEHNRSAQVSAVSAEESGSWASCSSNNTTRTWPANIKINGNVTIGGSCRILLEGDAWITGQLTLRNSGTLAPADSYTLGSNPDMPTVMVDGQNGVVIRNQAQVGSNSAGTGIQLITYWSDAACSPDCSDVTGDDLYRSQNVRTISVDAEQYRCTKLHTLRKMESNRISEWREHRSCCRPNCPAYQCGDDYIRHFY